MRGKGWKCQHQVLKNQTKMNDEIHNSRKNFEKLGSIYDNAESVTVKKEVVENVNCYWFNKEEITNTDRLMIYENQNHVWMLENIHNVESKKSLEEIQNFINE